MATTFDQGKHEPRPKHYSFLKMLDEVAASSVNLSLGPPFNKLEPDIPSSVLLKTSSGAVIVPNRSSSLLEQQTRPKRSKASDSESESSHTRSISRNSQLPKRRSSCGVPDPLSLWDSSSFDTFIDEAFLLPNDTKSMRVDMTVTKQEKPLPKAAIQGHSRPKSMNNNPSVPSTTARDTYNVQESSRNYQSTARQCLHHRGKRRNIDPEDDRKHSFHCTPSHRFKLMQTLKDLNKRSGKKRKMTSGHAAREPFKHTESLLSMRDALQADPQAFSRGHIVTQNKNIITLQCNEDIKKQSSAKEDSPPTAVITTSMTAHIMAIPPSGRKSANEHECGPLPFGFPVCNTLARSRTNPQRSRPRTSPHDAKKRATIGTVSQSQIPTKYNMTSNGSPRRIRKLSQDGVSIKNLRWRTSSRTSSVRPVSPLVHLVPPSAPPQCPLPQIPQQPRRNRTYCSQYTFSSVRVAADEPPRNNDDFKRFKSSHRSSTSTQNRFQNVVAYKEMDRTSKGAASYNPPSMGSGAGRYVLSESESEGEIGQPISSPLKLRSRRTRRNAQVHELKKRHSMKQGGNPKPRSQRSSLRTTKPLRTRSHNRVDSQTLPQILSKLERYRSGSSKEVYSDKQLSYSGVLVLVDSDSTSLHGFRAGAVSPEISFSNPWKTTAIKDKRKIKIDPHSPRHNQGTKNPCSWRSEDQVSPRKTYTISHHSNNKSDVSEQPSRIMKHRTNGSQRSRDELQSENERLNEEIKRMARVYNTMVFARQGVSQSRIKSYSELLEDDRRTNNVIRKNSNGNCLPQHGATKFTKTITQIDTNGIDGPSCPPSSPASTIDVDTYNSRPNSPCQRKDSMTSTTSRPRKGSDSSLTDPNDYDCLSYTPVTTQPHYVQKVQPGSCATICKATDQLTSILPKVKEEEKKYTTSSLIAV